MKKHWPPQQYLYILLLDKITIVQVLSSQETFFGKKRGSVFHKSLHRVKLGYRQSKLLWFAHPVNEGSISDTDFPYTVQYNETVVSQFLQLRILALDVLSWLGRNMLFRQVFDHVTQSEKTHDWRIPQLRYIYSTSIMFRFFALQTLCGGNGECNNTLKYKF